MKLDEINSRIKQCKKCQLHKTRTHSLPGEGQKHARIMLIATAPGEKEDKEGRMFIGPSGSVLNNLLQYAGIERTKIYMTNLIKCMLPRYRKPEDNEIKACSSYLELEIEIIAPDVLIPLGYYATRYIFNKYGLSILPKKEFSQHYAKLIWTGKAKIFPLQHPAALLHRQTLQDIMKLNYRKLKILSENCKWYSICPIKELYECGKLERKWIELYCKGDWESCVRYHKEENGVPHSDNMLPDGTFLKD